MATKAKQNVINFFEAWKKADYETMYNNSTYTWRNDHHLMELITIFEDKQLLSYTILKEKAGNPVIFAIDFKIKCRLKHVETGEIKALVLPKVRTVPELRAYSNNKNGFYGVNVVSVLNRTNL